MNLFSVESLSVYVEKCRKDANKAVNKIPVVSTLVLV